MTINQWVPSAHRGDAVGDNARMLRDLFRAWGHDSAIYAIHIDDDMAAEVRPWTDPAARTGDVTIYHFAVPSEMSDAFRGLPRGRVLQYHNVTPPRFFAPWSAPIAAMCAAGRRELAGLATAADLALGDSEYNRRELDALGFARTGVMPIVVDTDRLTRAAPAPALDRALDDEFVNVLFVGRIVPNKCLEDVIRLAACVHRYVDVSCRYIFVGHTSGVPGYFESLRALASRLGFGPERMWFPGRVSDAELAAYYRHADVYVSMSEHEGFCVPLVEAMAMGVPVLAYAAGAVPDTLGGAGVTFSPKDLELASEWLGTLVYDEAVRARVIAGERARVRAFTREALEPQIRASLAAVA